VVKLLACHQCVLDTASYVVEFVVGSLLWSFLWVLQFSPLVKNQHFQILILAWRVSPISARELGTLTLKIKSIIIIVFLHIIENCVCGNHDLRRKHSFTWSFSFSIAVR